MEAVVYFIPGTRKANTPNRSSPRILPYPRVRRFISFIFGKKTSATVINAMQKRSAIMENGGIPVSPIFIRRYEQPQVMATMAIRILACPCDSPFFVVVLAVADFVIVFLRSPDIIGTPLTVVYQPGDDSHLAARMPRHS